MCSTVRFKKHLDEKKVIFHEKEAPLEELIKSSFNFVYASGDDNLCRNVAKLAGDKFIPFALNRSGINIAVVDETTNLNDAVEKIVYSRFLNNGQFPTSPDQIYVHEKIFNDFLVKSKIFLYVFFGEHIEKSKDYGRLLSADKVNEVTKLIKSKGVGQLETRVEANPEKKTFGTSDTY